MNHVSQQISLLRKGQGMTQEELAEKVGVTAQSISKWENGATMPDILLLPVLAEIFDVSIDALFSRSPLPTVFPLKQEDSFSLAAHEALLTLFHRTLMEEPSSQEQTVEAVRAMQEYLMQQPRSQCVFEEKSAGHSAYASKNLDVVLRLLPEEKAAVLKDAGASCILSLVGSEAFPHVFSYLSEHPQCALTAAAAAAKCGLSADAVRKVLESMSKFSLVRCQEVDLGEETVFVYSLANDFRQILLYAIFALSKRLFEYADCYYTAQKG